MAVSQNGWLVIESGTSSTMRVLPWITGKVRAGDVWTVLDYLGRRFNAEVEPIERTSSWGYAFRAIRGSVETSNHASGTAVDFNAPRHPLGVRGTFTARQVAAIRRILADLGGVVRWGGDYAGRADEMHFEINASAAAVARVAERVRAGVVTVSDPTPIPRAPTTVTPGGDVPAPIKRQDDDMRLIRVDQRDVYLVAPHNLQHIPTVPEYRALMKVCGAAEEVTRGEWEHIRDAVTRNIIEFAKSLKGQGV